MRALPTINPDDFWDYCYDTSDELIRREFGEDITHNVDKATIIEFAKRHPELRERYVKAKEQEGGEPYNLKADPSGYYQPYVVARGWTAANLLAFNDRLGFGFVGCHLAIHETIQKLRGK